MVLGVVTILLGLAFAGLVPFLQRDVRVHTVPAVGLAAAPVLGFLFGLGWTPCIGPTLGRDHHARHQRGHGRPRRAARRDLLLRARAPVHRGGLAYRRTLGAFGVVRRHQQWVTRLGGAMLVLVGLALLTGYWDQAVPGCRSTWWSSRRWPCDMTSTETGTWQPSGDRDHHRRPG